MDESKREKLMKWSINSIPWILKTAEESLPKKEVPQTFHDTDTFDDNTLTLGDIKELKKVFKNKTLPVHHSHYTAAAKVAKTRPYQHYIDGKSEPELIYQTLATELDKPRKFPLPEPTREPSREDKEGVLRFIDNALTDLWAANILHKSSYVEVRSGNGMSKDSRRLIDTALGRRLEDLADELKSLKESLLPPEAKDRTPVDPAKPWWHKNNEWDKTHVRRCSRCSSACEVKLDRTTPEVPPLPFIGG